MNFIIEKGVPVPPVRKNSLVGTMRTMAINDSLALPINHQRSIHSAARTAGIKCASRKLDEDTIRVWRVA